MIGRYDDAGEYCQKAVDHCDSVAPEMSLYQYYKKKLKINVYTRGKSSINCPGENIVFTKHSTSQLFSMFQLKLISFIMILEHRKFIPSFSTESHIFLSSFQNTKD
jgi:hypothetical protein